MTQYSASEEERETICCFLEYQDTKESPKDTKSSDESASVKAPCPIRITKGFVVQKISRRKEQSLPSSAFEILQNTNE